MAPVNDVLSAEMLLCFILQYLDPVDSLRCRRVCSYFNQVILSSSMVKRACYHLPIAASSDDSLGLPSEAESATSIVSYTINPTLKQRFPQFFKVAEDNGGLWGRWDCSTNAIGTRAWEAVVDWRASWRNMLVAQPPITRLDVLHVTPNGGNLRYTYEHDVHDYLGGLTMGSLYCLVREHLKQPNTNFALDWSGALAGSEETYDIGMLAYPDGRLFPPGSIHPPPIYPPTGVHQIDLSAAKVTVLLRNPGWRVPAPRKRADKAWYEKWSLESASRPGRTN